MRNAIIKGAKVGAITGFVSALGYAVIALILVELFLPIPDPAIIVIFGDKFFDLLSTMIIPSSPFWLFGSTVIGGITAIGFTSYLEKSHPPKQKYIYVCTLACTIIASPLLLLTAFSIVIVIFFNGLYHPFINPILDPLLETGFPAVVFILAGFLASNYLYKNDPTANI